MSAIEFPLKRIESIAGLPAALDAKASVLTASKTVNIPYGTSAAEIQALIDAEPKNLNGHTLTFQFEDCPHKYFNGTTDGISGNGTTATVTLANHGLTTGQTHHIDGTTNFNINGVVTVTDENTFTIAATYNGTETPPATAIVRKAWILNATISIEGFYSGDVYLQGNTDDSAQKSTVQRVVLHSTAASPAIMLSNNLSNNVLQRFKLYWSNADSSESRRGIWIVNNSGGFNTVSRCYLEKANNRGYMFEAIDNLASHAYLVNSVIKGGNGGANCIASSINIINCSNSGNAYGMVCNNGWIMASNTFLTGTTANELKSNGGQIWS